MDATIEGIIGSQQRVYFAHSMRTYHTEKEHRELSSLKKRFPNIICPNHSIGTAQRGMSAYLSIVAWADLVIVSEYEGYIGRGVHDEVKHALNLKIPVYGLRESKYYRVINVAIRNPRDYRFAYAELITNNTEE